MSKIKGLLCSIKGNEESSVIILPYNKQIEGYQKTIKKVIQAYNKSFVQPYSIFCSQISQLNKSALAQLKSCTNKSQFYLLVLQAFADIQKSYRNTNLQIKDYSEQGLKVIQNECQKLKITLNILHQKLKQHETKQNQLNQDVKKYSNNHKNLCQAIDSYKNSFQDVKLIYNIQQKVKRYKTCQALYNAILQALKQINQIIQSLSGVREELKVILQQFKAKSLQFARSAWLEIIKIPYNIMKCFINGNKSLQKIFKQKLKMLQQKDNRIIFQKFRLPYPSPQHFDCEIQQMENSLFPTSLANIKFLKTEHFGNCKRFILQYYKSTRQDMDQKITVIDKMKIYFSSLSNILERMFSAESKQVKDTLNQKIIKLILDGFCPSNLSRNSEDKQSLVLQKLHPVQKSIYSIVDFLEEEKNLFRNMSKLYSQQIKQITQEFEQQSRQLTIFKQQLKSKFYFLFEGKKQFKKDLETLKSGQMENLSLSQKEVRESREQIIKKSQSILIIVTSFAQKFKMINSKVKNLVISFFEDYSKHINYEKQIYQKEKNELNQQMNYLFDSSITSSIQQKNQNCWIFQNSFYKFIVKENTKVKFDSQIEKVNSFTKLKKPNSYQQKSTELGNQKSSPLNSPRQSSITQKSIDTTLQPSKDQLKPISINAKTSDKRVLKKESVFKSLFSKNYEQFFIQNVKMQEGQKYVSNFPCGLADNIIISGRLYVSTHRLFFHSRFNASNIFFGDTKLQIPKTDIKKIQKRYNAIIFDNSISVTTVNGQIFFTSFISRDKAFQLICETFQISQDDHVFISEQQIQEAGESCAQINVNLQQEDDLLDSQIQSRSKSVDQIMEADQKQDQKAYAIQYKPIIDFQITFPGLNAAKFFKIFESGQQFIYKNKTYSTFWHYFKCQVHKNQDLDLTPWQPNILEYLNPNNIKSSTPLKFTRKLQAKVPIPPNSIPFMPKFLQCAQNSTLYFHSKNKYITINHCVNSKAPYTDCFYMKFKRVVEKTGQNTINIKNSFKMIFTKSPLVRKMIESKTYEQSIENYKSHGQEYQKYLKFLQQTMNKKSKNIKTGLQKNQNNLQIQKIQEQYSKKIEKLEEQNQILNKNFQSTKLLNNNLKIGLIVSLIVNIILFLIIMIGLGSQNQKEGLDSFKSTDGANI